MVQRCYIDAMKYSMLLILGITCIAHQVLKRITAVKAAQHIGERVNVVGKVYGFNEAPDAKTTLVYLAATAPQQQFTIIVEDNTSVGEDLAPVQHFAKRLLNQTASVVGTIVTYQGKPAIRMKNWKDVGVLTRMD